MVRDVVRLLVEVTVGMFGMGMVGRMEEVSLVIDLVRSGE